MLIKTFFAANVIDKINISKILLRNCWNKKINEYDSLSKFQKTYCNILCFFTRVKCIFSANNTSFFIMKDARNMTVMLTLYLIPFFAVVNIFADIIFSKTYLYEELKNTFLEDAGFLSILKNASHEYFIVCGVIIGIILSITTFFFLFSNIEHSINNIWSTDSHNQLTIIWHSIAAFGILCCIFIIIPFFSQSLQRYTHDSYDIYISSIFQWIIYFIIILLTYKFVPIHKIKFDWGLCVLSLITAGLMLAISLLAGWLIGMPFFSKYDKIYGVLAAFPITLIFLFIFSIVILFGAFVSFYVNNIEEIEREEQFKLLSHNGKETIIMNFKSYLTKLTSSVSHENEGLDGDKIHSLRHMSSINSIPFCKAKQIIEEDKRYVSQHAPLGDYRIDWESSSTIQ